MFFFFYFLFLFVVSRVFFYKMQRIILSGERVVDWKSKKRVKSPF